MKLPLKADSKIAVVRSQMRFALTPLFWGLLLLAVPPHKRETMKLFLYFRFVYGSWDGKSMQIQYQSYSLFQGHERAVKSDISLMFGLLTKAWRVVSWYFTQKVWLRKQPFIYSCKGACYSAMKKHTLIQ